MILDPGTMFLGLGSLLMTLALKDIGSNVTSSLFFCFFSPFKSGDPVYIDDQKAIIVKIGLRNTLFGIETSECYKLRYVENVHIRYVKLEKMLMDNSFLRPYDRNNHLAISSSIEKGE